MRTFEVVVEVVSPQAELSVGARVGFLCFDRRIGVVATRAAQETLPHKERTETDGQRKGDTVDQE